MLMVSDDSSWSCCFRSSVLQISMTGRHSFCSLAECHNGSTLRMCYWSTGMLLQVK